MSRQRYEPIPQRPHRDEVIILDSIHNSPTYNYNSGVPNSISSIASQSQTPSIASSTYTPSLIASSIPNSPPPSFHTHSSPGTPRPTPSTSTRQSNGAVSYAELWGVAPSTVGGDGMTEIGGTSNDALATIAGLKQRIEWLEESIGKLLIEKDNHVCNSSSAEDKCGRDNCCVTFTDASPDLERILSQGKGTNCCVKFRRNDSKHVKQRTGILVAFVTLLIVAVMITVMMGISAGAREGRRGRGDGQVIYGEDRS